MTPRRSASQTRKAADLSPSDGAPNLSAHAPTRGLVRTGAVVYLRVSSKDQEKEGFSIPAQQRLLQDYAEARGLRIDAEFTDVETAKRAGREQFGAMVAWFKKHKNVRTLLVEKTDRLYRNPKDWVTLDEMGLEIHLVKEGTVLSEDSRSHEKFIHGIRVVMAKNYIDNLSEETRKGMAEKAEQGIWPGPAPAGYTNVGRADGKRVIDVDPVVAPLVQRLFSTYAMGGISVKELARQAFGWGLQGPKSGKQLPVSGLHYILTNLIYTGEFVWKGRTYKGIHTPLISRELWDRVQDLLTERCTTVPREQHHEFLFTGLVRCGLCAAEGLESRMLIGEIQKGKYIYYHCDGCRAKKRAVYIREEKIDAAIQAALRSLHFDEDTMAFVGKALRDNHADQRRHQTEARARLKTQYETLQRRIDVCYEDRLDGRISTEMFERKSAEWRTEQARLRRELEHLESTNQSYLEDGLALLELARTAAARYTEQATSERRKLLYFVLLNSTWRDGNLEVVWRKPFNLLAEAAKPDRENETADLAAGGGHSKKLPLQDLNLRPTD